MSADYSVQGAITESRALFLQYVWPLWQQSLKADGIISVEDSEQALERAADASGTDAFMVRHSSRVLVPLASRIEKFNEASNNPRNPKYADHYPRFTVRLGKRSADGSYYRDVECRKRIAALDDPIARRYLALYTIQSLLEKTVFGWRVLQTSRVETDKLYEFVRLKRLDDPEFGTVSRTRKEGDEYRIVTVERLLAAKIHVECQFHN